MRLPVRDYFAVNSLALTNRERLMPAMPLTTKGGGLTFYGGEGSAIRFYVMVRAKSVDD